MPICLIVSFAACLLPWEPIDLRSQPPRGEVILHARCYISQILLPPAGLPDGCAQQHPRHSEDDGLYVHVPWET